MEMSGIWPDIFYEAKEKKLFVSIWPGVKKKSHAGGLQKMFFSYFFCNIVVLFYSFFYLDSIHYIYFKWFMSIKTSSWYMYSIFKMRVNFINTS